MSAHGRCIRPRTGLRQLVETNAEEPSSIIGLRSPNAVSKTGCRCGGMRCCAPTCTLHRPPVGSSRTCRKTCPSLRGVFGGRVCRDVAHSGPCRGSRELAGNGRLGGPTFAPSRVEDRVGKWLELTLQSTPGGLRPACSKVPASRSVSIQPTASAPYPRSARRSVTPTARFEQGFDSLAGSAVRCWSQWPEKGVRPPSRKREADFQLSRTDGPPKAPTGPQPASRQRRDASRGRSLPNVHEQTDRPLKSPRPGNRDSREDGR
jgi:hypothetical protein